MSKQRGHEHHGIEDIGDMVNDISNLPDCILDHILSFMPTKDVVKTSILSTRWKNLWASVPNIDFDDNYLLCAREVNYRCKPDVTSFENFVERVLRLRDASNMKKFRLSCYYEDDPIQMHSWISDAIVHNVQELDLDLKRYRGPSVLPESMFESTSLISLKIRMNHEIEHPPHFSFPCLKSLHLSFVPVEDDDFTEKLFSGCPVLEELVLIECKLTYLKNVVISSSTLKRLTIQDSPPFQPSHDPTSDCKIKIDAANLTYFKYNGFLSNVIILKNVSSSLVKACIHIRSCEVEVKEVAPRAIDLFQQLKHVVSLKLSSLTMTLLFSGCIYFPVFSNLRHLKLSISNDYSFGAVMDLLSLCPVLQSICFSEVFGDCMDLDENNSIRSSMPTCISNSLKRLTFKYFCGYNSEICFLKCLMKTACALERMDILWSEAYSWDLDRKTKREKELEEIEMKAKACVIKFSCMES